MARLSISALRPVRRDQVPLRHPTSGRWISRTMLRASTKISEKDTKWRDRIITSTDPTLLNAGIAQLANAAAGSKTLRKAGEALFGLHWAPLPHLPALTKQHLALGDENR